MTYSFIIPHKNSLNYLRRCIDSIPNRDDIQIVVIDDNSNDFKEVKETLNTYPRVELLQNHGSGAGGARNTGIELATGDWLLFADCDDFYVDGFLEKLDLYRDSVYDVIYFNFNVFLEDGTGPINEKVSTTIDNCAKDDVLFDYVKYKNNAPWNKMIKRNYIELYNIRFEEQPIGNDIFFSYQVGFFSNRIKVVKDKLYNYIVYKRSETRKEWDSFKIQTYLENKQKYNGFMEFVKHPEWKHGLPYLLLQLYKLRDIKNAFRILCYYIINYNKLLKSKNKYPQIIQSKQYKNNCL